MFTEDQFRDFTKQAGTLGTMATMASGVRRAAQQATKVPGNVSRMVDASVKGGIAASKKAPAKWTNGPGRLARAGQKLVSKAHGAAGGNGSRGGKAVMNAFNKADSALGGKNRLAKGIAVGTGTTALAAAGGAGHAALTRKKTSSFSPEVKLAFMGAAMGAIGKTISKGALSGAGKLGVGAKARGAYGAATKRFGRKNVQQGLGAAATGLGVAGAGAALS